MVLDIARRVIYSEDMPRNREGFRWIAPKPEDDLKSGRLVNSRFEGFVFAVRFDDDGRVSGVSVDAHKDDHRPLNASLMHEVPFGDLIARARVYTSARGRMHVRQRAVERSVAGEDLDDAMSSE